MKVFKNRLFIFLLGGILFSSISVIAVNQINASQVTYTDSNNNETTVDAALNNLYTEANKYNTHTFTLRAQGYSNSYLSISQIRLSLISNYKYFKINSVVDEKNNASDCKASAYSVKMSQLIELTPNTNYEINSITDEYEFSILQVHVKSSTDGTGSQCLANITFFN